jgi:hypothetical protein
MVLRAPPTVMPPPVLMPVWETIVRLAFMRNKPLDLYSCPTSSPSHRFYSVTDKLYPVWFWDTNQETVVVILMLKSSNRCCQFWDPNQKICHRFWEQIRRNCRHQFWGQTGENRHHWFWGQIKENYANDFKVKPLTNRLSGFEPTPLTNRRPWFWSSIKKLMLLVSSCTVQTAHNATWHLDRSITEYPTCATIIDPLH